MIDRTLIAFLFQYLIAFFFFYISKVSLTHTVKLVTR